MNTRMTAEHNSELKKQFNDARWSAYNSISQPHGYSVELNDGTYCHVYESDLLKGAGFAMVTESLMGSGNVIDMIAFDTAQDLIDKIAPRVVEKTFGERFGEFLEAEQAKPVPQFAQSYGFAFVTTGGGCDGLRKDLGPERYILITALDDPTQCPQSVDEPVLVGICDDALGEYPNPLTFHGLAKGLEYASTLK